MKQIKPGIYESQDGTPVPIRVFASQGLLEKMRADGSLKQAEHVAQLPGIIDASLVMPDAHLGYGFPVGGVAATDAEHGFISPGGIGFDINCGVRLLVTTATRDTVKQHLHAIINTLFKTVPTGMGTESSMKLSHEELDRVLVEGVPYLIGRGIGNEDDASHCENNGVIAGADASLVSPTAKKRGKNQLGTLGSGNHFLEIQVVENIFDEQTATAYGLSKDQVVVMIHCGSRGLGHQICTDYLRLFESNFPDIASSLVEKDLMYAPITSHEAKQYIAAMHCAMNFAWANRHVIGDRVRDVFSSCGFRVRTLYDLGHNNAKLEEHNGKQVYVHRKGAARAFPKGHHALELFQDVGHPVLVPGSMGTASYVLCGMPENMTLSFGSCCHGAGRQMSRRKASNTFTVEQVEKQLAQKGVLLQAKSKRGITDEAPGVYKDIDEVISVCHQAGIATPVVKLRPIGVIKG